MGVVTEKFRINKITRRKVVQLIELTQLQLIVPLMDNTETDEFFHVATRKDLAETGGAHNQKGIDFQRAWAIERMFELESSGAQDFLFLFESIQDIAELDSATSPTSVRIYQVKKKDRDEWSWTELTHLAEPGKKRRTTKGTPPELKDSPLGKLYSSALAFKKLNATGIFISNSGCNLPLTNERNAATSSSCDLSNLDEPHLKALSLGLETFHDPGTLPVRPALIHVEKTPIHPDQPTKHLIGTVVVFLNQRSQRHAGQAQALVEALLAKVGPLGAKTNSCATFAELRKERGYTKAQFSSALSDLEEVPDLIELLDECLNKLVAEGGIAFIEKTAIRVAASKFFRLQVMGGEDPTVSPLLIRIDAWLDTHTAGASLTAFLDEAKKDLASLHASIRSAEFAAHFLLRALKKCVVPI